MTNKRIQIILYFHIVVFFILLCLHNEYYYLCEQLKVEQIDPARLKEIEDFIFSDIEKVHREYQREQWLKIQDKVVPIVFIVYMICMVLIVCSVKK